MSSKATLSVPIIIIGFVVYRDRLVRESSLLFVYLLGRAPNLLSSLSHGIVTRRKSSVNKIFNKFDKQHTSKKNRIKIGFILSMSCADAI